MKKTLLFSAILITVLSCSKKEFIQKELLMSGKISTEKNNVRA